MPGRSCLKARSLGSGSSQDWVLFSNRSDIGCEVTMKNSADTGTVLQPKDEPLDSEYGDISETPLECEKSQQLEEETDDRPESPPMVKTEPASPGSKTETFPWLGESSKPKSESTRQSGNEVNSEFEAMAKDTSDQLDDQSEDESDVAHTSICTAESATPPVMEIFVPGAPIEDDQQQQRPKNSSHSNCLITPVDLKRLQYQNKQAASHSDGELELDDDHRIESSEPIKSKDGVNVIEGPNSFPCEICGKILSYKHSLDLHLKMHANPEPFSCDVCGKSFRYKATLKMHSVTHTSEPSLSCEICGKQFYYKHELKKHSVSHTEERPFACELCDSKFKTRGNLTKHKIEMHQFNDPLTCRVCGNLYKRKATLMAHMRKDHEGAGGSFPCEVCGKTFGLRENMKTHMRVHTGEKPFACEICGKRFTAKASMQLHVKQQHETREIFKCEMCSKTFLSESSLEAHIASHSGEKPFPCQLCGRSFTYRTCLLRHSKMHSEEIRSLATFVPSDPFTTPVLKST